MIHLLTIGRLDEAAARDGRLVLIGQISREEFEALLGQAAVDAYYDERGILVVPWLLADGTVCEEGRNIARRCMARFVCQVADYRHGQVLSDADLRDA